MPAFSSVAEYLSALDPKPRKQLKSVIDVVRKNVPDATECISYGIPAFRRGKVFLYCAAFKQHIGVFPPVRGDARLKKALEPYANAKGNLAFPLEAPLPLPLIGKVAKALAKDYAAAPVTKAKSRGSTRSR